MYDPFKQSVAVNGGGPMAGDAMGLTRDMPVDFHRDPPPAPPPDPPAPDSGDTENPNDMFLSELSREVWNGWTEAKRHREIMRIDEEIADCERRRQGQYNEDELAAIKEAGKSTVFANITEPKCFSCEAYLGEIMAPATGNSVELAPTPLPDLPPRIVAEETESLKKWARLTLAQTGMLPGHDEMLEMAQEFYRLRLRQELEAAIERAKRMWQLMEDQLVEGGFRRALTQFNHNIATFPTAVLCGPIRETRRRAKWGEDGTLHFEEEAAWVWRAPHPKDFWHSPNARNPQEGDTYERIWLQRRDLYARRDEPGWSARAIAQVLDMDAQTAPEPDASEHQMAELERREQVRHSGITGSAIEAVVSYRQARGKELVEWGMEDVADPNEFYEICCIMAGREVVYAILNPHPMAHRPYRKSSYRPIPNSAHGVAIALHMKHLQDEANVIKRAANNNIADASGFQTGYLADVLHPEKLRQQRKVYPGGEWPFNFADMRAAGVTGIRDCVMFFQPEMRINELNQAFEACKQAADDLTGIPRYLSGQGVGTLEGALKTASGLLQARGDAARGMKQVIINIELDVVEPALQDLHLMNLIDPEVPAELKGDARIRARGALAQIIHEEIKAGRMAFAELTNNADDRRIMTPKGRRAMLANLERDLDVPEGTYVPRDDEEMEAWMLEDARMQSEVMMAAMPPMPVDEQGNPILPGDEAQGQEGAPPENQQGAAA